jgi:hypothetical protein
MLLLRVFQRAYFSRERVNACVCLYLNEASFVSAFT